MVGLGEGSQMHVLHLLMRASTRTWLIKGCSNLVQLWWIRQLVDQNSDVSEANEAENGRDSKKRLVGESFLQVNRQAIGFLKTK